MPAFLASIAASCAPAVIRVMVFNVEYGGDLVDFRKTVEAVALASPDVVLIEEAWGNVPRLARDLRFPEHDVRHHVMSRLPLLDPPEGEGRFLFVEAGPGCVAALANVHLPSDPSVSEVLEEHGLAEAIEIERRSRLRALEPTLESLAPLLSSGAPVLLGGDFNTRSHLDDGRDWPTSRAVHSAGLRDVFRSVHPDPASHPGFTWWAARPRVEGWNPSPDSPQSRIDRLYAGGPVTILEVLLVGEAGGEGVDMGIAPWPSDHRALVATLEVSPAPAPTLIAAWPPRVVLGDEIRVRSRGFGSGWRIVFELAGSVGSREAGMSDVLLPTAGLEPGPYEVVLLDPSGMRKSASPVFLVAPGQEPSVSLSQARVKSGETIRARWSAAPGNRWDWVGVYKEGADFSKDQPLLWRHTGALVTGEAVLDGEAEGGGWPLAPGSYRLFLCEDDAYRPLASAAFTVEP